MFELKNSTFLLALILSKSAIIRGYLKKAQYNFGSPEFQALLVLAFAAYVQAGQWIYVEDPYGAPPGKFNLLVFKSHC